jgi:uncharacterized membrane protein YgcG
LSDTLSETTDEVASVALRPSSQRPGRRRRVIAIGVVVALVGIAAGLWGTDPFAGPKATAPIASDPTSLATVTRQSLSSQTQVNATLGYSGTYTVVVPSAGAASQSGSGQGSGGGQQASGAFTALPAAGQLVAQGQPLYSLSLTPVVLLYGSTPASRTLSEGLSGADVAQLNADLVSLGDASKTDLDPNSDYFSAATAAGVEKLQSNLAITQTGTLTLGQAVFLPTAIRVTSVSATLGAPAQPGATVLQATSTTRAVIADLDADQQSEVTVGDKVTITLPSNQTTPGVVSKVGTVATTPSSGGSNSGGSSGSGSSGGSGGTPTIEVDITPSDPASTGALDQAPVTVTITTATVNDALVVPVDALLALSAGRFAVEVVGFAGVHHLVPVTLGLFDDADGLVQVTASGLSAGERVVVPKL